MSLLRKIITFIAIVLPLLSYYEEPFSGLSLLILLEIIVMILVTFVILIQPQRISLANIKEYAILIFWIIFITLFMALLAPYNLFSPETRNNFILMIIVFVSLLFGLSGVFNLAYGIRVYKNIVIISIVFLALQIFFYYILDIRLSGILPFLHLSEIYYPAFYYWQFFDIHGYVRLSSFFSEPSHFALYTLPFLCMNLFGYKNMIKKNFKHAVIITIFILLSTSGNGIVASGIVWSIYFISNGEKNINKRLAVLTLGITLMIVSYNLLMNFPFFSEQVNNLFTSSGYGQSKADYRIYRGFAIYFDLPISHQLFGTGFRAATAATQHYGISTQFDIPGAIQEYFSAITQILIYSGIIGLFLFGFMFTKLYKKSKSGGKVLIIVFLALAISSSIFMDTFWQLYMMLIFGGLQSTKQKSNLPS